MKNLLRFSLILGLLTFAAGMANAAEDAPSYRIDIRFLRVKSAQTSLSNVHVLDETELRRHIESGQIEELQTTSGTAIVNEDAQWLSGQKIPLSYFDPRANGPQVQYVDCGLKVAAMVRDKPVTDHLRVDLFIEKLALVEHSGGQFPDGEGTSIKTSVPLKPGQVVVAGAMRGHLTGIYLQRAFPNTTFADSDTVLITVSVHKLN